MKKQFPHILVFLIAAPIILFFCKKENNNTDISLFYGNWKTSYGDTIEFSRTGNKNILRYDYSFNPALPTKTDHEYTFRSNKMGVKNGFNGTNNFHFFQSFRWLQRGQQFEVPGTDWFSFISSTQTYFTFTKIP